MKPLMLAAAALTGQLAVIRATQPAVYGTWAAPAGACVYCHCGDGKLTPSGMVPDDTVYPGVQMICADGDACIRRIHDRFHQQHPSPECEHCR